MVARERNVKDLHLVNRIRRGGVSPEIIVVVVIRWSEPARMDAIDELGALAKFSRQKVRWSFTRH